VKRQHSVPLALVASLLQAPRIRQVDIAQVCEEAGLPGWLDVLAVNDPALRLPIDELGQFLIALWRHMQDEAGGFLSRPLKLGTFSMMCHALISAGNMRRGLLRSARYIALVTDDVAIRLEESGDEAHVVFDIANPLQTDEAFFTTSMFIIWIRLFCWLIDQPMLLDRVQFTFDEPDYSDEFGLIFPCRHDFCQPRNVFTFNRRMLSITIKQDASSLVEFLHQAPQSLLTQFRDDDSVTAQIKRLLLRRNGLHSELVLLSFDEVAQELVSTTHTLRRRLKEEGHSYQEIKDSLRRDQALALLERTDISMQELAQRLGFSEAAAFTRAFKKWTGLNPSSFRDTLA
jgi:AraC-like DNA-binding protein